MICYVVWESEHEGLHIASKRSVPLGSANKKAWDMRCFDFLSFSSNSSAEQDVLSCYVKLVRHRAKKQTPLFFVSRSLQNVAKILQLTLPYSKRGKAVQGFASSCPHVASDLTLTASAALRSLHIQHGMVPSLLTRSSRFVSLILTMKLCCAATSTAIKSRQDSSRVESLRASSARFRACSSMHWKLAKFWQNKRGRNKFTERLFCIKQRKDLKATNVLLHAKNVDTTLTGLQRLADTSPQVSSESSCSCNGFTTSPSKIVQERPGNHVNIPNVLKGFENPVARS